MAEQIFIESAAGSSHLISRISYDDDRSIAQALAIYDISLGMNYIPPEDLLHYLSEPGKYVLLGSYIDTLLTGVMLAYQMDHEELISYDESLKKHGTALRLSDSKIGMIKSVAVVPSYRHRGIGTRLTIRAMEELLSMSCNAFFATSWVSNSPDSSQPLFTNLGFDNILTIMR